MSIDKDSVKDAKRILTFLCCSMRPLTVRDLIEAVAVDIDGDMRLDPDARLFGEDQIHHICPGLFETDTYSGVEDIDTEDIKGGWNTVRIAHFSVKEYLESDRADMQFRITQPQAHAEMASVCLTYLLEPSLSDFTWLKHFPFASYATNYWHLHCHRGDDPLYHVESQAVQLIRNQTGDFIKYWNIYMNWSEANCISSPIECASILGIKCAVTKLFDESKESKHYIGALMVAIVGGHKDIVQFFIDKRVGPDSRSGQIVHYLRLAIIFGCKDVFLVLLNEADRNRDKLSLHGLLICAARVGDVEIVQMLLGRGVDDAKGGDAWKAAARGGHRGIVKMLLDQGADVDAYMHTPYYSLPAFPIPSRKEALSEFRYAVFYGDKIAMRGAVERTIENDNAIAMGMALTALTAMQGSPTSGERGRRDNIG